MSQQQIIKSAQYFVRFNNISLPAGQSDFLIRVGKSFFLDSISLDSPSNDFTASIYTGVTTSISGSQKDLINRNISKSNNPLDLQAHSGSTTSGGDLFDSVRFLSKPNERVIFETADGLILLFEEGSDNSIRFNNADSATTINMLLKFSSNI